MGQPKRALLKLSGESLCNQFGIDQTRTQSVVKLIQRFKSADWQLSIVIGGGNWIRGKQTEGIDRTIADQMGMLATVMNGQLLQSFLLNSGIPCKVFSSFKTLGVDTWDYHHANQCLDEGNILLFVGGTGNPYFSTDSCAALRAIQIKASVLLKATTVDGIYDKDPNVYAEAKRYDSLTFDEAIRQNLQVMDITAFDLCRSHNLPIQVFDMRSLASIEAIIAGKMVGTLVTA